MCFENVRGIAIYAFIACMCAWGVTASGAAESDAKTSQSAAWKNPDPAAMKRWQDMRFGMFIHWGPVSLTGKEIGWSRGSGKQAEEYDNLYKKFNPVKFNADEWVSVAKAAGMKYMVLTTKHHDGFCLFNTKLTSYSIMSTPFHRDVMKELAEACKKQGMALGAYYSVCDWYHPDFPGTGSGGKIKREKSNLDAYNDYLLGQIKELITQYGPLITIWNDVPQHFKNRGVKTIQMVRELQPDILINDRTGDGGDYSTPEQKIGEFQMARPWETCMTICRQWAWKPNDNMKSLEECLQTLIRTVGNNGNLLFNVGPTPEGEIEARQVDRLKEMGAWLQKYGESIYGTRGGPFKPSKHFVSTRKGNMVYLHIFSWPEETLSLPALPGKIKNSSVLTGGKATVQQSDSGLTVSVPQDNRQAIDTIVALELESPALDIAPIGGGTAGASGSLTTGKKATASAMYQKEKTYGAEKAVDGKTDTRWATDSGTKQAWLEVDLGKPETIGSAAISEYEKRVKSFELQAKDGDNWKTIHKGAAIGTKCNFKFAPITAQVVRLNILEATDGPSIFEFELFPPAKDKQD